MVTSHSDARLVSSELIAISLVSVIVAGLLGPLYWRKIPPLLPLFEYPPHILWV